MPQLLLAWWRNWATLEGPLDDRAGTGLHLEVHRSILPSGHPFDPIERDVWQSSRRITVGTTSARVPAPKHLLLHTCIHFAWSHRFFGKIWRTFHDVHAICDRYSPDWDEFIDMARATRAATCCYWTLHLARTVAGAAVPARVLAQLEPRMPRTLHGLVERHYASNLFHAVKACPSATLDARL